jgi:superfamily II DNA or RNA helicase
MKSREELISDWLGEVEMSEARLLAWGMVDGVTTWQELIDRADAFLNRENGWAQFSAGEELVDEMERRCLLVNLGEQNPEYRSRFAETVRLLARLKQLFPKHMRGGDAWLAAPTLVADFRMLLRPRTYPLRDVAAADVVAECCSPGAALTALQRKVMQRLVGLEGDSPGFPLAAFQKRATSRILVEAMANRVSGSMVCAGTGSGKTLAFYLPALTHIAGTIEQDRENWVRALALYPRKELLKDQFTECMRMVRKVNSVLQARGLRPLRIAAFYSDTPYTAETAGESWEAASGGQVCPFLACPSPDCGGKMIWSTEDRTTRTERLRCANCNLEVKSAEIALTRAAIERTKPDILFTTTEMLNRRLSDSRHWDLFGVGMEPSQKPSLLLLDEAHTYAGTHGAQVAYLLRRWRHRAGCAPHIVGLSATLMEAVRFFAQLTGVPEYLIEEVSPEEGEMIQEGMEYMVALRGDPVSGTSLLSTTIQTAMLLRRMLDLGCDADSISHGLYGSKLFVFTDNLDVINRLYFSVLDAEGLDSRGLPAQHGAPLAGLRASTHARAAARLRHGQRWKAAEDIGHSLADTRLRIGRVSSQDAGVEAEAEIIVATASLEVGFNDPDVGAVLQHKAPKSVATFLQRKGRAGRPRSMRPWLLVVLSDYGRDRLAYSGYDLLFDPELLPQTLPVGNRHVLKMQGLFAFLDWLGRRLDTNTWLAMSDPSTSQDLRDKAAKIIEDVLAGGDDLRGLENYLRNALQLTLEEVQLILWEPPRALLTAALPTLLRRLRYNWMSRGVAGAEHHVKYHPLPEFIPASLFDDLNLPEVVVRARLKPGVDLEANQMPVAQALCEFAPGRVSRRFGVWHRSSRHWIAVDPAVVRQHLEIEAFSQSTSREFIGHYHARDGDDDARVAVYRPFALDVREDPPKSVRDSSNAFMDWRTRLSPPEGNDAGLAADLPAQSRWSQIFHELRFFTHQLSQPARCCRYSIGARAELRMEDGTTREVTTRFEEGGQAAALGFEFEMDAIRARVRLPDVWDLSAETMRALRVPYFRWRLMEDERLDGLANSFQRQWMAEIIISALSATAVADGLSMEAAWERVRAEDAEVSLEGVLEVIFQSVPADAEGADPDARIEQKRQRELAELLGLDRMDAILADLIPLLWRDLTGEWEAWVRGSLLSTIGASLQTAIQQLCPESDVSDLLVDLEPGVPIGSAEAPPCGFADIWISEQAPGGGGLIERLLPRIAEDPRRFIDLLGGALLASDFEVADMELTRLVEMLAGVQDPALNAAVQAVRAAETQVAKINTFDTLRRQLRTSGVNTTHVVVAAISTRILRPGSTAATDVLLRNTIARWRQDEARLGIEIDSRALAFALSSSDALDTALGGAPGGSDAELRQWRFGTVYGLLWPRGPLIRNYSLASYNPYCTLPAPERLLLLELLAPGDPEIVYGADDWRAGMAAALGNNAGAVLVAAPRSAPALRESVLTLLVVPVDTGAVLLYPRIRGVLRREGNFLLPLELAAPGQIEAAGVEADAGSTHRLILKSGRGSRDEVRDLVESLLAVELLAPGADLWLVSPWITDVNLLDNRSGGYTGLEREWPKRMLTLAELLACALKTSPQTTLHVVTRPAPHNRRFIHQLRTLCQADLTENRLVLDDSREVLHVKGFAGSSFALKGSMNFTYNGIEVLEEAVELEIDAHRVASFLLNLSTHYPRP